MELLCSWASPGQTLCRRLITANWNKDLAASIPEMLPFNTPQHPCLKPFSAGAVLVLQDPKETARNYGRCISESPFSHFFLPTKEEKGQKYTKVGWIKFLKCKLFGGEARKTRYSLVSRFLHSCSWDGFLFLDYSGEGTTWKGPNIFNHKV